MKEKIKNAFSALGFELEELEKFGCRFLYEGSNYLWIYSDDDDDFLSFALPGVLDLENVDEMISYKVMDYLNSTLKYVKVNKLYDGMWFFYERELVDDEDLERIISRMISHLYNAMDILHKILKKFSAGNDEDSVDSFVDDFLDIENIEIANDDYSINDN